MLRKMKQLAKGHAVTRWQPSQGSRLRGILSSLPQVSGMRSKARSLRQRLPLAAPRTRGCHHPRLRGGGGVPPGPDTAPWRQWAPAQGMLMSPRRGALIGWRRFQRLSRGAGQGKVRGCRGLQPPPPPVHPDASASAGHAGALVGDFFSCAPLGF